VRIPVVQRSRRGGREGDWRTVKQKEPWSNRAVRRPGFERWCCDASAGPADPVLYVYADGVNLLPARLSGRANHQQTQTIAGCCVDDPCLRAGGPDSEHVVEFPYLFKAGPKQRTSGGEAIRSNRPSQARGCSAGENTRGAPCIPDRLVRPELSPDWPRAPGSIPAQRGSGRTHCVADEGSPIQRGSAAGPRPDRPDRFAPVGQLRMSGLETISTIGPKPKEFAWHLAFSTR
jgi:hypothetical protein